MSKAKVHLSLFRPEFQMKWDLVACGQMIARRNQSVSPSAVTCLRCKRTKAYREAVKAAEEKKG